MVTQILMGTSLADSDAKKVSDLLKYLDFTLLLNFRSHCRHYNYLRVLSSIC